MIDVCIDILKFLIPTLFSIWTVTRIIPQFAEASSFVFGAFAFFLLLLVLAIIVRVWKVRSYVSKFKEEHDKFLSEHANWQIRMTEILGLELNVLQHHNDGLEKQYELVKEIDKTMYCPHEVGHKFRES